MKRTSQIQRFLGTLLMMAFFLISTFSTSAAQTAGIIDNADESGVRGWAINTTDPAAWSSYGDGTYLVEAYGAGQKLSGTRIHPVGDLAAANLQNSSSSLRSLGVFRTTAYCPCRKCSGGWGGRTSTGTIAAANHTISVDPRVIPYGSRIMIGGVVYTAEDCGGGVKGNHIDIFFNTHGETRAYGSRNVEVYLVQ